MRKKEDEHDKDEDQVKSRRGPAVRKAGAHRK